MAIFTCPQCGHSQAVDDKHIGKTATCPKCRTQASVQSMPTMSSPVPSKPSPSEPTTRHRQQGKLYVPYKDDQSTLLMEWVVVDDPRLPVQFTAVCGVIPSVDAERMLDMGGGAHFCYLGDIAVKVGDDAVTALEMRFLLFDVWGTHVRTLSAIEVTDLRPGHVHQDKYRWTMYDHGEGRVHYASIGYIARVRTADGRVHNADTDFVLREAQRFTEKFTEEDLEPEAPKKER